MLQTANGKDDTMVLGWGNVTKERGACMKTVVLMI